MKKHCPSSKYHVQRSQHLRDEARREAGGYWHGGGREGAQDRGRDRLYPLGRHRRTDYRRSGAELRRSRFRLLRDRRQSHRRMGHQSGRYGRRQCLLRSVRARRFRCEGRRTGSGRHRDDHDGRRRARFRRHGFRLPR